MGLMDKFRDNFRKKDASFTSDFWTDWVRGNARKRPMFNNQMANLDTLFTVFIHNTVNDPDFALSQDPLIYDQMLRDPYVVSVMRNRVLSVTGLESEIIPNPQGDQKEQQILAKKCAIAYARTPRKMSMISTLYQSALLKSMGILEGIWTVDRKSGDAYIKELNPVSKEQFNFTKDGNLKMLSRANPIFGEEVTGRDKLRFISHTHGNMDLSWNVPEKAGYRFFGRGLGDTLYWLFLFKKYAEKFWMKYLEKFAVPFPIGYYPYGDTAAQSAILEVLESIQAGVSVTVPRESGKAEDNRFEIDIKDPPGGSKTNEMFFKFVNDYCNKQIGILWLGQTLTTDVGTGGKGSFAAAKVHNDVRLDLVQFDKQALEETISNQWIKRLVIFNKHWVGRIPEVFPLFRYKFNKPTNTEERIGIYQASYEMQIPFSKAQFYEEFALVEPSAGDDEVLVSPEELMTQSSNGNGNGNGKKPTNGSNTRGEKPSKQSRTSGKGSQVKNRIKT